MTRRLSTILALLSVRPADDDEGVVSVLVKFSARGLHDSSGSYRLKSFFNVGIESRTVIFDEAPCQGIIR